MERREQGCRIPPQVKDRVMAHLFPPGQVVALAAVRKCKLVDHQLAHRIGCRREEIEYAAVRGYVLAKGRKTDLADDVAIMIWVRDKALHVVDSDGACD